MRPRSEIYSCRNTSADSGGTITDTLRVFLCGLLAVVLPAADGFSDNATGARNFDGPVDVRPNVVFIMVDDLGWTDLGCYGSDYYETPHIDKLAVAGMKFTQGYAACTVCSPTRASLMTDKYPPKHGVTDG